MNAIPSAAAAFLRQHSLLAKLKPQIIRLREAVGRPNDLNSFQWAQLMAMVIEFEPDLILELGRGCGNSTCAFTIVANELASIRPCRVLSLCRSDSWRVETMPKLQAILPATWFALLSALEADICSFDYKSSLAPFRRIAVFWDAHGFEVAATMLAKIMPELADKPHVVMMHDLSDTRYLSEDSRSYGDKSLWTGNDWSGPRVRLGHIESTVEQSIAALDFTTRNRIELHSADHSLHTELTSSQREELENSLGELYSLKAFWYYFSLNEGHRPFFFPRFQPKEIPVKPSAASAPSEQSNSVELEAMKRPHRKPWLVRTASRWKRSIAKRLPQKGENAQAMRDQAGLQRIVERLPEDCLLSIAGAAAELRPMGPYPGWFFGRDHNSDDPVIGLRQAIWKTCNARKLEKPVVFPWYDGLRINLISATT